MPVIRDAGLAEGSKVESGAFLDAASVRKARIAATARQLRNAQTDDDAAEALSAILELAKD